MWCRKQNVIDSLCKYKYTPTRTYRNIVIDASNSNRAKLETLSQGLHIKEPTDWYNVSQNVFVIPIVINIQKDLRKSGIKESLFELLTSAYPEHEWLPWKFQQRVPRGFWENASNQRKFADWAATQFKIKEMSDWYNITSNVKKRREIFNKNRIL
jgi:hypothetical protein